MGPALSSVTSLVAKLPSVTKVLSLFINTVCKTLGKSCFKVYNIPYLCRDTEAGLWSSSPHIQDAYVLTKSLISAPMGITGSSSAKEVEAAGDFDIQTSTGSSSSRTKRQISRGESRGQRSDSGPPTPTAEVRSEQRAATSWRQPWENRNIKSWELSVQLVLTLGKWLKTSLVYPKCLIKVATKWL